MLLEPRDTFEALRRDFRWEIPADFNIGRVVSDDWAAKAPERICLQHFSPDGDHLSMTYGALAAQSSALAHGLTELGVVPGDRVALLLPQCFETVIAHVAIYKMGAIALPLALLFGEDERRVRPPRRGAKPSLGGQEGEEERQVAPLRRSIEGTELDVDLDRVRPARRRRVPWHPGRQLERGADRA